MDWRGALNALTSFEGTQAMRRLKQDAEAQVLYEALDSLQAAIRAMDEAAFHVALARTDAAMAMYEKAHELGDAASRHPAARA
jgi:cell fate (sporulation/competence/biofilm development) regulator YlbF (YheA/YmcA/DUF963 family)